MFTTIAGIIVGTGLIIGGLNIHDDNYADNDSRLCCEDRQVHDRKEHAGYGMGIVGGAVLALTVKRYWDNRNHLAQDVRRPFMPKTPGSGDYQPLTRRHSVVRPDSVLMHPHTGLKRIPLEIRVSSR